MRKWLGTLGVIGAAALLALLPASAVSAVNTCSVDGSGVVAIHLHGDPASIAFTKGGTGQLLIGNSTVLCGTHQVSDLKSISVVNDDDGGIWVTMTNPQDFTSTVNPSGLVYWLVDGTTDTAAFADKLSVYGYDAASPSNAPEHWTFGQSSPPFVNANFNATTDATNDLLLQDWNQLGDTITLNGGTGSDVITANGGGGTGGPLKLTDGSVGGALSMNGYDGNDTLVGGAGDDWLLDDYTWITGASSGNDKLYGEGGDDNIQTVLHNFNPPIPGNNTLKGGSGNDFISAAGAKTDLLDGGPGKDRLTSYKGADTLIGGTGKDRMIDLGNDSKHDYLKAKDGTKDKLIDCGPGHHDKVKRDHQDPFGKRCEHPRHQHH